MAYKVTGNIADDARIIVLSETNMSIEHNEEHTAGVFEAEDLTNNSKIVLARKADGETFGYAGVSPVEYQSGIVVPYVEDFSSYGDGADPSVVNYFSVIGGTSVQSKSIYNNGTTSYLNINSDSSSDAVYQMEFDYALIGDFDIRFNFQHISFEIPSSSVHYCGFILTDALNGGNIQRGSMATHSSSPYVYIQSYVNGSQEENDIAAYPGNPFILRVTRAGGTLRTYYWNNSWQGGGASSLITSSPMLIRFYYKQESWSRWNIRWDELNIAAADGLEVVTPLSVSTFTELAPGISYDIEDTILDFTYDSRTDATNIVESTADGLRVYSPANKLALLKSTKVLDSTKSFAIEFNGTIGLTSDYGLFGIDVYADDATVSEGFSITGHAQSNGVRLYERTASSSNYVKIDAMSLSNIKFYVAYEAANSSWAFYINDSLWHTDTHNMLGLPVRIRMQASSWGTTIIDTDIYNLKIWGSQLIPIETLPYTDDFTSGINDWLTFTDDPSGEITWYNNDSMRMWVGSGSGNYETIALWNRGLDGDFDVEVEFSRLSYSGFSGGSDMLYFGVFLRPDRTVGNLGPNFIGSTFRTDHGGINHTCKINNSYVTNYDSGSMTWQGKFRFARTGTEFVTYYDIGSGWVEAQRRNITDSDWTGPMFLHIGTHKAYTTTLEMRVHSFTINSGTVVIEW